MCTSLWLPCSDISSPITRFKTETEVTVAFLQEVAARAVVLLAVMSRPFVPSLSPSDWLAYVLSVEGGDRVSLMLSEVQKITDPGTLRRILEKILFNKALTRRVVVALDDAHLLMPQIMHVDGWRNRVLNAVRQAAKGIPSALIISGSGESLETAFGDGLYHSSGVGKSESAVETFVLGRYQYLKPLDVMKLLGTVLNIDCGDVLMESVMDYLGYVLQGRAKVAANFVARLLTPEHLEELPASARTAEALPYTVLFSVLSTYMQEQVLPPLEMETRWANLPHSVLGHLLTRTMLANLSTGHDAASRTLVTSEFGFLAFVKGVTTRGSTWAATAASPVSQHGSCLKMQCVFGEPGLLEVLLRLFEGRKLLNVAGVLAGLETFLKAMLAAGPAAQASALGMVVAMMAVVTGAQLVPALYRIHHDQLQPQRFRANLLEDCHHLVQVRRIVRVDTEERMLEFFQCVQRGPESDDFSLMRGTPIRCIAVLPIATCGPDLIVLATREPAPPRSVSGEIEPRMGRKRKLENRKWVLINFVNSSRAELSTNSRQDQAERAKGYFLGVQRPTGTVRAITRVLDELDAYIVPVLVEMPSHQGEACSSRDYVLLTQDNAVGMLTPKIVETLAGKAQVTTPS
jgi:hypothetical protein